jgi:ATP-dependent Zn protease
MWWCRSAAIELVERHASQRVREHFDGPWSGTTGRAETNAAVDAGIRKIVDQSSERAVALLTERRDVLERTARRLPEKETLDESKLRGLLRLPSVPLAAE